ncbi:MAG: fibronectin type III domain-containing protein [Promethearchaeota archaeon]
MTACQGTRKRESALVAAAAAILLVPLLAAVAVGPPAGGRVGADGNGAGGTIEPAAGDRDYAWLDDAWRFRLRVNVTASPAGQNNTPVQAWVNFTALILPHEGEFNDQSVRVVEYPTPSTPQVVEAQFEPDASGWDNATNASGEVIWIAGGWTPPNATRVYFVYFDVDAPGEDTPEIGDATYFDDKIRVFGQDWEFEPVLHGFANWDNATAPWGYDHSRAARGNASVRVGGNCWKRFDLGGNLTLQANYRMTFAVYVNDTDDLHEIVGVGLSKDDTASDIIVYEVHGSQDFSNTTFKDAYPQDRWNYYTATVGIDASFANASELLVVGDDDTYPSGIIYYDDVAIWNRTVNVTGNAYPGVEVGGLGMFPTPPHLHPVVPAFDTDGNVTLVWDAGVRASEYHVFRDMSPIQQASDLAGKVPVATTTALTYEDLTTGNGTYYYVVVSENEYGNSTPSNNVSVVVAIPPPPNIVPTPPVLEVLSPSPSPTGNVSLSWTEEKGATEYFVFREFSPIQSVAGLDYVYKTTGTSHVDLGLQNGTYYYVVVAANDTGWSDPSNCENITVRIPLPPGETYEQWSLQPGSHVLQTQWSGGFSLSVNLTVTGALNFTVRQYLKNPTGYRAPEGATFFFNLSCSDASGLAVPLEVELVYDEAVVAGFVEDYLEVYQLLDNGTWVELPSVQKTGHDRLSLELASTGLFSVQRVRNYLLLDSLDAYSPFLGVVVLVLLSLVALGLTLARPGRKEVDGTNESQVRLDEKAARKGLYLVLFFGVLTATLVPLGSSLALLVEFSLLLVTFTVYGAVYLRYEGGVKDFKIGPYATVLMALPVAIVLSSTLFIVVVTQPIYQIGVLTITSVLFASYFYTVLLYVLREKYVDLAGLPGDMEWNGLRAEEVREILFVQKVEMEGRNFKKLEKLERKIEREARQNNENGRVRVNYGEMRFYKPVREVSAEFPRFYGWVLVYLALFLGIMAFFVFFVDLRSEGESAFNLFLYFFKALPVIQTILWVSSKIGVLRSYSKGIQFRNPLAIESDYFSLRSNFKGGFARFLLAFLPFVVQFRVEFSTFASELFKYMVANPWLTMLGIVDVSSLAFFVAYFLRYDFRKR